MPRQVSPTTPARTATAPYNFVPLPEQVFDVADGIEVGNEKVKPWELHDRFVPGTHSGSIQLTLETLTPLFVRGAVGQKQDGTWDDRDSRLRPDPYTLPDGRPAIPGSSLRGMVRSLVEILSFSKLQPVSAAKPFFRTVADDRIGRAYRNHLAGSGQKPRGGLLRIQDGSATIAVGDVARVQRAALQPHVQFSDGPNYTPPWPQQHGPCWVKVGDGSPDVTELRLQVERPAGSEWRAATLVLTGNAPNKKREFVFLERDGAASQSIRVPESIWTRFHDEDQLTNWQERAYPRDRPQGTTRKTDGHLRHGEPVFFLVDDQLRSDENPDGLVFLGRAGMFRFPYDLSPADIVPQHLREARLDLAEAMFGKVDRSTAIKGRVQFEDAVATGSGPTWCEPTLVPKILSAPKPTTFQHYLTQDGSKGRDQLATYLTGDNTAIRGHKVYWHRWDNRTALSQVKEGTEHNALLLTLQQPNPTDTQHTLIRPVKAGVTFVGRIHFENLTTLELGALLHALELPAGCCHRLGIGKPLGLGSVRVATALKLVDRDSRYRAWQASGVRDDEDGSRMRNVFVEAMLAHARASKELLGNGHGLRQIARLDVLFHLLEWTNRPGTESTVYMDLARFRDRPVLPTPHSVAGANEPPWPANAPRPEPSSGRGHGSRGGNPDMTRRRRGAAPPIPARPRQVAVAASELKPIQKGQTRSGTLKSSGTNWVAMFDGDAREARIINPDKLGASCSEGTTAEFYITEQSKSAGVKCRFERVLVAK